MFEIAKTNVIKVLEEVELKSRKLEIITRMAKDLEKIYAKILRNEKKHHKNSYKKVTGIEEAKREINERRKMVVLEIRTRAALEIE